MQLIGGVEDSWGGPSKVVVELAAGLAKRGHDVEIITTDVAPNNTRIDVPIGRTIQHEAGYSIRYHRCERLETPYVSSGMLRDVWKRARDFDLVHVHGVFNIPTSAGQAILRARKVPYVVRTCGNLDTWSMREKGRSKAIFYRMIERANLKAARRLHVSTRFEYDEVAAHDLKVPITICPQGVADGEPTNGAPSPNGERPYVLFLSRVNHKKGLIELVEAFSALATDYPTLDLVICGPEDRDYTKTLKARITSLGLTPRVLFQGMVRGALKTAWFENAAAFALPSHDENFGIVVVEAAQGGAPILVSHKVGLADAVAEHAAGIVCRRDAGEVETGLRQLLDAGRAHYAEGTASLAADFTWPRCIERIEAMYVDILAEVGGRR